MEKGTHGINEETFENLSFSNQAKSINGQIRIIEKSITAHVRKAGNENRDTEATKTVCIDQLERMIGRLRLRL